MKNKKTIIVVVIVLAAISLAVFIVKKANKTESEPLAQTPSTSTSHGMGLIVG